MRIFRDNLSTFTHWFGWTLAVIASLLFIFFDISEWLSKALKGSELDLMWFYGWMLFAIIGVGISLFKRIIGSVLMLAGGIGMVGFLYMQSHWIEANMMIVYGLPFILPAFLLLTVKK